MSGDDPTQPPATPGSQTSRIPNSSGSAPRSKKRRKKRSRIPGTGVIATAVQDINRLRQIVTVLTRHGFYEVIQRTGLDRVLGDRFSPPEDAEPIDPSDTRGTARRLRLALEDLGTTFIKLGQILSTRPDLLPQVYIQEFAKLQDRVPPMPFEVVQHQIEAGLGHPLEELFAEVDPEQLATASIGQVHRATTLEGEQVVVKVRRPDVAEQIRSDLDILYTIARLLEATIQEMSLYSVVEIVREFERAIVQEINFLVEADNVRQFRRNFAEDPHVTIPRVYPDLSSKTILTLEYLEGRRFRDLEPGEPETRRLVEVLLDATYTQIFEHGFFHADPHPGNIIILGPDRIGLIDFGLVGRLSRPQQDDLVTLVVTVIGGDTDGVARTLLRMGYPQGRVNLSELKREIARTRDKYINENLHNIDISAFSTEIMDAAIRYQIKINPEYSLLVKAIVTLDGILRDTDPEMDLETTAAPYARKLLLERYSSKRVLQNLLSGAMNLSGFLRDIPAQLDQVLMDLESGAVTIQVRNDQLDDLGPQLTALGTRLGLGLVSAGLIVGGSVMLAQLDYRPFDIPLLLFAAISALVLATLLSTTALLWPLLTPRLRRLRIGPLISMFRRQQDRADH